MSNPLKFVVAGFRHGHIFDVVSLVQERPDTTVVGGSEAHEETRAGLESRGLEFPVFESVESMLDAVECDVVAVGDYYGARGRIVIEALKRGKHVLSDKPFCISLAEWEQIRELASSKNLSVGCQLDLRSSGVMIALRNLVQEGEIGEVHAAAFNGQHPLLLGTRPEWYFEPGKQGGTIVDIAVHAIDALPWITGFEIDRVDAARNWSTKKAGAEEFRDAAQVMLTLENGAGVLGDVSYLSPDSFKYGHPFYWEFTMWGSRGVARTSLGAENVLLYQDGKTEPVAVPAAAARRGYYLDCLLREIHGRPEPEDLSTGQVLTGGYVSLQAQRAADETLAYLTVR